MANKKKHIVPIIAAVQKNGDDMSFEYSIADMRSLVNVSTARQPTKNCINR